MGHATHTLRWVAEMMPFPSAPLLSLMRAVCMIYMTLWCLYLHFNTVTLCAMKSRTLQAASLAIALFFLSWLVLSSNSEAPSKLLAASRAYATLPKVDVPATDPLRGNAGTPDGAASSFLTDEQVEVLRKAGLLTAAQLEQLESAAKHWKEEPAHMTYETVDEAARHKSDPVPNGRPPMPEVAKGLTLDPHKSWILTTTSLRSPSIPALKSKTQNCFTTSWNRSTIWVTQDSGAWTAQAKTRWALATKS
jgi:hypothetical protein